MTALVLLNLAEMITGKRRKTIQVAMNRKKIKADYEGIILYLNQWYDTNKRG
jgi:hypothetical protein